MEMQIHADRRLPALVHGGSIPWRLSPEHGVERRMLERDGGEVAIASSLVRYRPGSRFSRHLHELGEEFLVLEGTFSDEEGDYPAGTYVRNPPGSSHSPFSADGCVIFVKLRQMSPHDTRRIRVFAADQKWHRAREAGREVALLQMDSHSSVTLERLRPGTRVGAQTIEGGEEIFVVNGRLRLLGTRQEYLESWDWLRRPGWTSVAFVSETDSLLWVKRGHLNTAGVPE